MATYYSFYRRTGQRFFLINAPEGLDRSSMSYSGEEMFLEMIPDLASPEAVRTGGAIVEDYSAIDWTTTAMPHNTSRQFRERLEETRQQQRQEAITRREALAGIQRERAVAEQTEFEAAQQARRQTEQEAARISPLQLYRSRASAIDADLMREYQNTMQRMERDLFYPTVGSRSVAVDPGTGGERVTVSLGTDSISTGSGVISRIIDPTDRVMDGRRISYQMADEAYGWLDASAIRDAARAMPTAVDGAEVHTLTEVGVHPNPSPINTRALSDAIDRMFGTPAEPARTANIMEMLTPQVASVTSSYKWDFKSPFSDKFKKAQESDKEMAEADEWLNNSPF